MDTAEKFWLASWYGQCMAYSGIPTAGYRISHLPSHAKILNYLCSHDRGWFGQAALWEVSRAYVNGRLTYAPPAWWGSCTIREQTS